MTDSELFWNITLGENQGAAWNLDDAFIRPATGIGGQVIGRFIRYILADEGEVPRLQFKDVRATIRTWGLEAVGVWRWAESSCYHSVRILDYSKVTVKSAFLQSSCVPKAGHHQAVCAEIVRLLFAESKRHKLSNYALAQRSGVSESMVSLVERGLRNPSMELVLKLADGIGADLPKIVVKAQKAVPAK